MKHLRVCSAIVFVSCFYKSHTYCLHFTALDYYTKTSRMDRQWNCEISTLSRPLIQFIIALMDRLMFFPEGSKQ